MAEIRITPGGTMEAIGSDGVWQTVPKAAQDEIEELRRRLGGGCDANAGGGMPAGVVRSRRQGCLGRSCAGVFRRWYHSLIERMGK